MAVITFLKKEGKTIKGGKHYEMEPMNIVGKVKNETVTKKQKAQNLVKEEKQLQSLQEQLKEGGFSDRLASIYSGNNNVKIDKGSEKKKMQKPEVIDTRKLKEDARKIDS